MRFQTLQRPLALLMSFALVMGLIPTTALAEALEILEEETVAASEPVDEGDDESLPEEDADDDAGEEALAAADADGEDALLGTPSANDPFYFAEYDDPEAKPVTTLHTSGTYLLVDSAGSAYTEDLYQLIFTPTRALGDIRGNTFGYDVQLKTIYEDDGETVAGYLLEDFTYFFTGSNASWQLPTGKFSVALGDGTIGLEQRYQIVNDGNFVPYGDLTSGTYHEFSIKPYTDGATDGIYDGYYYDEDGEWQSFDYDSTDLFDDSIDEEETFRLADDTRIKLQVDTAVNLSDSETPQLESIGLWKCEAESPNAFADAYGGLSRIFISRAEGQRLDEWDNTLAQNPDWPTYLNFASEYDDNVTIIWEADDELEPRFVAAGDATGSFIFDQANFADADVENGVYFPVVRMSYHSEDYTFAYYPVVVDGTDTADRNDPRITTKAQLLNARVGEQYEIALAGKAGATPAGDLSWALADGSTLPDGLELYSDRGTIAGEPTQAGTYSFAIELTETVEGVARTATKTFTLRVLEAMSAQEAAQLLTLGEVSYTPGTIWAKPAGERGTFLELEVPISLDVTEYDLDETELWYMVQLDTEVYQGSGDGAEPEAGAEPEVGEEPELVAGRESRIYVLHENVAELYKHNDRSVLEVPVLIYGPKAAGSGDIFGTKAVKNVRMFLVPKDSTGAYAFKLGPRTGGVTSSDGNESSEEPVEWTLAYHFGISDDTEDYYFIEGNVLHHISSGDTWRYNDAYKDLPSGAYAELDNPDIALGSWVSFPALSFEGDDEGLLASEGRVQLWSYDGSTVVGEPQVEEFSRSEGATFKVAPGTYAFSVEARIPVYDEYGVQQPGMGSWVDVGGTSAAASAIEGTNPRLYVFTIGPNEGTEREPTLIDMTYSKDTLTAVNSHSVVPTFQLLDGSYGNSREAGVYGYVRYQVNWYRRTGDPDDETSDLLVGTGDTAIFASSTYPLYVEVVPIGRDNAFWKSKKQLVPETSKSVLVELERKQRFTGTFELSCASNEVPSAGQYWGIIEVQIPTNMGDVSTYNLWASDATVRVDNLTSGAKVTFTPTTELKGAQVSYTVPEDATEAFTQPLVAPLAAGLINFEPLRFVDARGNTTDFTLDDGYTGIEVRRGTLNDDGTYNYSLEEPFYLLDGSSIILQSDGNDGPSFMSYSQPTRYRVTLTHKDPSAPERLGATASDVAARKSFDIVLSSEPGHTTTTIEDEDGAGSVTLESRGYGLVPLNGVEPTIASLVLFSTEYDAEGKIARTELVDKAPAGTFSTEEDLRTPFLDAGTYTLFSVYSDAVGRDVPYDRFYALDRLTQEGASRRASRIDFEIEDGAVTDLGAGPQGTSHLGAWCAATLAQSKGLVDKSASYVTAEVAYTNMASIQMHAELAKGVTLSDEAKLEIVSNQASGEGGQGYMHPRSLTINGKALTLNRWEYLFRQTQNMANGELEILLAEAKKQGANCAKFPMDLTLIVPLSQNVGSIDASIWLVDGDMRTLVGSCHKAVSATELVVPEQVAWTDFYVYGETGANARVTIFVDGMQAATTRADRLGYYTANITLPSDVSNGDQFALTATAQWTTDGVTGTTTTEAQWVTYTTTLPVVERISLCYQYLPGERYRSTESYYRGYNPNKYERIYRAENEFNSTTGEHALQFWVVEFANAKGVTDVKVVVPRDSGDITIEATDSPATAQSWIPDVRNSLIDSWGWSVGKDILTSLTNTEPHGFVTKPTYFATSPTEIAVDYRINLDAIRKPSYEVVENLGAEEGAFQGYAEGGMTEELLAGYLDTMAAGNYLQFLSNEEVEGLGTEGHSLKIENLPDAQTVTQRKLANAAGCDDGWLLLGDGLSDSDGLLLLQHKSSVTSPTAAEMRDEFEALVAESADQRATCMSWLADGTIGNDTTIAGVPDLTYKDNKVVLAFDGSAEDEREPSCRAYVVTEDDDGNAQWEMLSEYVIRGTDGKHYYTYQRMDKQSLTYITWDEANLRRVEVSYKMHDWQVSEAAVGFSDLYWQWNMVLFAIQRSLDAATLPEGEYENLYDATEEAEDDEGMPLTGYKEQLAGELVGYIEAEAALALIAQTANYFGIKSTDQNMKEAMEFRQNINDPEYVLKRTQEEGSRLWMFREAWDIAERQTINNVGNGAYNAATFTPTPLAFVLLFNPISPTEEGIKQVQKGKGNKANKKQTKQQKQQKPTPKKKKPISENMSDDELFDEYWSEWITGICGGERDMKRFWVLSKNRLKMLDARLQKFLESNASPDLLKKYKLQKQVQDPSGTVYEGVLSNPVEGATVTLYTHNPDAEALNKLLPQGDPKLDTGVFVDADRYSIMGDNPQTTGADGRYQWMVPEGYWQVRVSKEGYEDFSSGQLGHEEEWPTYELVQEEVLDDEGYAVLDEGGNPVTRPAYNQKFDDQGNPVMRKVNVGDYGVGATKDLNGDGVDDAAEYWMPVLPVQLDVNIPLVSLEAPTVASVEADQDGVTVTFSKYMVEESVVAEMFAINEMAPKSIEALDAEQAGDGSGMLLARTFRLSYPEGYKLKLGNNDIELTLTSEAGNARSYADVPLDQDALNGSFSSQAHVTVSISQTSVGAIAAQTYTGKALTPAVTLTYDGTTLVAGTDYKVSYANNVNPGTATATITGIGDYVGTTTATFQIVKQRVTWKRLWGNTALDTMQAIAAEFGKTKVAVVTTNADFHDALAASALAGANGALVLTTAKGSASKQTKAALEAAGVKTVYVVGRTAEVSKAAMNGLKYASGVTVRRVADKAGYSARAVELAKACGTKHSDTVIIATQASFKDALSIAPYSYATKSPILYAESGKKLSDATLAYIKGGKYKRAIIAGGPLALPTGIETQLTKKGGIKAAGIMRLAGADPYATSEVIAKWATGQLKNGATAGPYQGKMLSTIRFQPAARLSADRLAVSTSRTALKWKDALCGAALCGKNRGVLLLADDYDANGRAKNNYAKAVDFCHAGAAGMSRAYVLGGEAAVSKQVWNALVASTVV